MNNAFKNLGDFISGLTGLVMSLIGLGIVTQIAGFEFVDVIGSITGFVDEFASGGFVGLVALLIVIALAKKWITYLIKKAHFMWAFLTIR